MTTDTPSRQPSCDELDPNSLRVEQAREKILAAIQPLESYEQLTIRNALNRVLAEPIISGIDVPAHTNSAMDGYAVRSADLPVEGTCTLQIAGTVMAGTPLDRVIQPGECARIMTGGKIPAGTDTVIMQEHIERNGDTLTIGHRHRSGQNVRQAGEDLTRGEVVLQTGRKLTPADLGILASLGCAEVRVVRRIRVAFFSTGDELRSIGQALGDGQIYDSNRYTLYAMLKRIGADFLDMGIVPDQRDHIEQAFRIAMQQADVLITSGGVSVGEADFVKETLEKLGQVGFWKIAMKPGQPLAFGQLNECPFFGLPGNPVSAMVTFYQFVQPALQRMMGITDIAPTYLQLKCESEFKKRPGRLEFQRGIMVTNSKGELAVKSTGAQGSGVLRSMSEANCFIILPLECSRVEAGEMVTVQPFAGII